MFEGNECTTATQIRDKYFILYIREKYSGDFFQITTHH